MKKFRIVEEYVNGTKYYCGYVKNEYFDRWHWVYGAMAHTIEECEQKLIAEEVGIIVKEFTL